MRWITPLVCALSTTVLLTAGACKEEAVAENKQLTIAWLAKGRTNRFFDLSRAATTFAEADDVAVNGPGSLRVVNMEADDETAEGQAAKVDEAVRMGVNAIVITVVDPAIVGPAIDRAVDAGVTVVTFDTDAPASKRSAYFGLVQAPPARLAARTLVKLAGGKGHVVVVTSPDQSPMWKERVSAFQTELEAKSSMRVTSVLTCGPTEEATKVGCAALLDEALTADPEVTGFYLARARPLRETDLPKKAPKFSAAMMAGKLHTVGWDAVLPQLSNMKEGHSQLYIAQKQFAWGYDVVLVTADKLRGVRDIEPFVDLGYDVVCENNVDDAVAKQQAQDFRGALPPCSLTAGLTEGL